MSHSITHIGTKDGRRAIREAGLKFMARIVTKFLENKDNEDVSRVYAHAEISSPMSLQTF